MTNVSRGSFEVQHGVRSFYLHSGVLNYQGFHYGRPLLLEMRQNNVQHQAVLSNQIHKYYSKGVNNSGNVYSCVITKQLSNRFSVRVMVSLTYSLQRRFSLVFSSKNKCNNKSEEYYIILCKYYS